MSNETNIFANQDPIVNPMALVDKGDVLLVLKADGGTMAITVDFDRSRILRGPEFYNDEDRKMLALGEKLAALSFAATNPKIMQLLIDISNDPDVVDVSALAAQVTKH